MKLSSGQPFYRGGISGFVFTCYHLLNLAYVFAAKPHLLAEIGEQRVTKYDATFSINWAW